MGKFAPHAILKRKGKRGYVVRGREEHTCDRDHREGSPHDWDRRGERAGETLEMQGVLNIGEGD
jgi:hypothetical protein